MTKKETKQDKTLDQVLADIEKQFGKGSIMKLGENAHMEIETTSSGSIALDLALGVNLDQNQVVKLQLLFMQLQKYKKMEEEQHS